MAKFGRKTHSGTRKRTKQTGRKDKNGGSKIMFGCANKSHLLVNKSKKAKKRNAKGVEASSTMVQSLRRLLKLQ